MGTFTPDTPEETALKENPAGVIAAEKFSPIMKPEDMGYGMFYFDCINLTFMASLRSFLKLGSRRSRLIAMVPIFRDVAFGYCTHNIAGYLVVLRE